MSFLKRLFGAPKLNGEALARSGDVQESGMIELLDAFRVPRVPHTPGEQQRWSRALAQPYGETIETFRKQGWLEQDDRGLLHITPLAQPFVDIYRARQAQEKAAAMEKVRAALAGKDTGEALGARRAYEARFALGEAEWTGPEPQLSHSALTRRIFFLEHWLLDGFRPESQAWLKQYAAEQHLWGAFWQVDAEQIPDYVAQDLKSGNAEVAEAAYWKACQLALYVDNQETWQRCKGGDHVRRLAIVGPDDEYTCAACRALLGTEYLVARVPELPVRGCTSVRGCRCRYEPVLESYEEEN